MDTFVDLLCDPQEYKALDEKIANRLHKKKLEGLKAFVSELKQGSRYV